jgi:hypothetical protein
LEKFLMGRDGAPTSRHCGYFEFIHTSSTLKEKETVMVILLAFLIVLLVAGLGFALHFLWIVAAVLLVLWLAGMALGRGEGSGRHSFYRW